MSEDESFQRLMARASVEVVPRMIADATDLRAHLPEATRVLIAAPPGTEPESAVTAAIEIARQGMVPVPHIPARGLDSEGMLHRLLGRFCKEAGGEEVAVVAGGHENPGPFHDSLALFESGILETYPLARVGVAGHPEGHPFVGPGDLRAALRAKSVWSKATGISLRILTQFVFRADSIIPWARNVLADTVPGAPFEVGIPGPNDGAALERFAHLCCGDAGPDQFRAAQAEMGKSPADPFDPTPLARELARTPDVAPDVPFAGVHIYPFGKLARTAAWKCAAAGSVAPQAAE